MTHLIHFSDTHFGAGEDFKFGGAAVLPRVRRIVDEINGLDFEPDLIIHGGDVVDEPSAEAYALARKELGRLRAPVFYVRGNHDDGEMLLEDLPMGKREMLGDGISKLAYSVKVEEGRIFVLDGCDAGSSGGEGEISAAQADAFREAVRADKEPFLVFIHFPPLVIGSPWVDRRMLLASGEEFHDFLVSEARGRVRGVFFGHVHGSVSLSRDGIDYRGVASSCCRIGIGPRDEKVNLHPEAPVGFNHIAFSAEETVVREYAFAVA